MASPVKTIWLLLGLGAFLGVSRCFPAYDDEDFEELKEILAAARRGLFDTGDDAGQYLPDLYDYARKGKGYVKGYLVEEEDGKLEVVDEWPREEVTVGQVGGLAVHPTNSLVNVFHRADRRWTTDTFNPDHTYKHKDAGAISKPTVKIIDPESGAEVSSWGANQFYLPHGITIDSKGNYWVTDVAMHQVFKFSPDKLDTPELTLGKPFEPATSNDDKERFCMPADVVTASNGHVFVADGYCRSRILKFDTNGTLLGKFGDDEFNIPHSLALAEDLDLLCVADRENMRILCFNAGLKDNREFGTPEREYTDVELGRVYAIDYSPKDGFLYAVGWHDDDFGAGTGFTIDLKEDGRYKEDILSSWAPNKQGFDEPHALAVSPDGEAVYVGEVHDDDDRSRLWKFTKPEETEGDDQLEDVEQ